MAQNEALEAIMAELRSLRVEVTTLKEAKAHAGEEEADDETWMDEDGQQAATSSTWADVLPTRTLQAETPTAVALTQRFQQAPPLDLLKGLEASVPKYQGVPQAPHARRHRVDLALWTIQRKLEHTMNLMVHSIETGNPKNLELSAAELRSAWEDVLQQRRGLLAGRQAPKLDKRPDDNRTRLLSAEEEKKVFTAPPEAKSSQISISGRKITFSRFQQPLQGKRKRQVERKSKKMGKKSAQQKSGSRGPGPITTVGPGYFGGGNHPPNPEFGGCSGQESTCKPPLPLSGSKTEPRKMGKVGSRSCPSPGHQKRGPSTPTFFPETQPRVFHRRPQPADDNYWGVLQNWRHQRTRPQENRLHQVLGSDARRSEEIRLQHRLHAKVLIGLRNLKK